MDRTFEDRTQHRVATFETSQPGEGNIPDKVGTYTGIAGLEKGEGWDLGRVDALSAGLASVSESHVEGGAAK